MSIQSKIRSEGAKTPQRSLRQICCGRLFLLVSVFLLLSFTVNSSANLVAHWRLDEVSGTTASDSAGTYIGTLRGGPIWTKGIVGGALQFDGSDDCAEIGIYPAFNSPPGSFSVALWANIESWSADWMHSMIGNRSDGVGWCLRKFGQWWKDNQGFTQSANALSFTIRGVDHANGTGNDSPSNTVPPLNEWIHIVCVYDNVNNKKYIYFNGVEDIAWDTVAGGVVTPATQRFYIGARSNGANTGPEAFFAGKLDEVRFYDHALSAEDVAKIAIPLPPNLMAYWKFNDGSGTTAKDSAGVYDATLRGNPAWLTGVFDGALQLDGADDCIEVGSYPVFNSPAGSFSVTLWANIGAWSSDGAHSMIGNRSDSVGWCLRKFGASLKNNMGFTQPVDSLTFTTRGIDNANGSGNDSPSNTAPLLNEWIHIACVYDNINNKKYIYFDGLEDAVWNTNPGKVIAATQKLYIGARSNGGNTGPEALFTGRLDDVRFYDRAITADEIADLANPPYTLKAGNPYPADGAEMVSLPLLTWKPADVAAHHEVYFGIDPNLSTADFKGRQEPNSYHIAAGIAPYTTYYWRIDEIEAAGRVRTGYIWSFKSGPPSAFNPNPQDGKKWMLPDTNLTWTTGVGAAKHDVYFGTNKADVAAGTGNTSKGNKTDAIYDPGILNNDTAYFWRIDEIEANGTKHTGDLWRFRTVPDAPVTGPNLVGWWKLDDSIGTTAADSSSKGNDGVLRGNPRWTNGILDGALDFDGDGDYVNCGNPPIFNILDAITIAGWIKVTAFNVAWQAIVAKGDNSYRLSSIGSDDFLHFGLSGTSAGYVNGILDVTDGQWHHIAGVYDGAEMRIFVDGTLDSAAACTGQINISNNNLCIGENEGALRFFDGLIDDVRLYNRALTQDEIKQITAVDTTRANKPNPPTGTITDVEKAVPLSWTPGVKAAHHAVYIGTDAFDVEDAGPSDKTGIYRVRQDANSYTPPEGIDFSKTYFWRIDEVNTDTTVSKGTIWGFKSVEHLIIDDFEQYNDTTNKIYNTWLDYSVNNTGMTVGHLEPPFAETDVFHSGYQSMYMHYDNDGKVNEGTDLAASGTKPYSEAEREWLNEPQDFTRKSVSSLKLWFKGIPASFGSFTQGATATTFTVTSGGADIGGTSDQFHFGYKQLTGMGTITAKINRIDNTDPGAKAGVMFRDTLLPGSKQVTMAISPSSGFTFQRRLTEGITTEEDTRPGFKAPCWVRLRRMGNNFFGYYSTDGSQWEQLGPIAITMSSPAYVGLCVTSRNVEQKCEAEFSSVKIDGTATAQWQSTDIGIVSNSREKLYVILQDSAGNISKVEYSDPAASTINVWTPWNIPLSAFSGVNLQSIIKLIIGVGDRNNTQPVGSGDLYIDDIGLYLPNSGG